jgi:hypothetical protein
VTRRRSRAPGRSRFRRRRSFPLLFLLVAAVLAACGGPSATGTPVATGTSQAVPTEAPVASESTSTDETAEPTETDESDETDPTDEPIDEPTEAPSGGPPAGVIGSADECSGNDGNRDFFRSVADAVDWPVYCAVLPEGWFVDAGQYRLANGGWLEIAYRGPSGARLELSEGSFCEDADGCIPGGSDAGEGSFGDLPATIVTLDDGGTAIVAGRGEAQSWLAVLTGVDESEARDIAAALLRIED